jgi:hypothetical protein
VKGSGDAKAARSPLLPAVVRTSQVRESSPSRWQAECVHRQSWLCSARYSTAAVGQVMRGGFPSIGSVEGTTQWHALAESLALSVLA